jgi:hypothetical protein
MRKAATIIIPAILLLTAVAQFTGCEKYVLPAISVEPDTLRFGAKADSADVYLTTNVITKPEADNNVNWITTWPEWFDESSPVTIYVKENTGSAARTGILYFKSEALQKKLIVIQEGATF